MATHSSVLASGESQGRGSLVGCCLWGSTESDTTEVTWQQQQQSSHLRKSSPFPGSSSLSVAMAEFLAGRGEPLLNDLLALSLRRHSYRGKRWLPWGLPKGPGGPDF